MSRNRLQPRNAGVHQHKVVFAPSGRSALVADGTTILAAARQASEPLSAECGGRGACGRCLVRVLEGVVADYRVVRRHEGHAEVHACLTPVHTSLTVLPLADAELPKVAARAQNTGTVPLTDWAPWPLDLDPVVRATSDADLGVAVDIGTTTLRLLVLRLTDGMVVGESSAYNPQILRGADVISRIVAAETGLLEELARSVRDAVRTLLEQALPASSRASSVRAYVVAGNLTMMHLLLAEDPSGIRRVPPSPSALAFEPRDAGSVGWPGAGARVFTLPAAGGWVGGDITSGMLRTGFPRLADELTLYVDLGTNGEIALGGRDFALACACSAGPAFEGSGIRCGMRADRGAIDGVRIDPEAGTLELSVIGGGRPRGVCGSGLISLADALYRAGWIDRHARVTEKLPELFRTTGQWGAAVSLTRSGSIALWERDLASLLRAKGAIFAGIRSLVGALGDGTPIGRIVVSGNFGRYLNLPAAIGIGLLPDLPTGRYAYVDNGSLEGAALALLSRAFLSELHDYLPKITYITLSDLPSYMDDFVAACFLPHTDPSVLAL